MHPKTYIYPHFYTPYEVLINIYPRIAHVAGWEPFYLFIYLLFFILLRRMGKNKSLSSHTSTYQIHVVFRFNPPSRCNNSSRCCYRAREHVDPAWSRRIRHGEDIHPEMSSSPGSVGLGSRINLHNLGHVSWVGFVLQRSWTTSHNGRSGSRWSGSWSIWSICPAYVTFPNKKSMLGQHSCFVLGALYHSVDRMLPHTTYRFFWGAALALHSSATMSMNVMTF